MNFNLSQKNLTLGKGLGLHLHVPHKRLGPMQLNRPVLSLTKIMEQKENLNLIWNQKLKFILPAFMPVLLWESNKRKQKETLKDQLRKSELFTIKASFFFFFFFGGGGGWKYFASVFTRIHWAHFIIYIHLPQILLFMYPPTTFFERAAAVSTNPQCSAGPEQLRWLHRAAALGAHLG